MEREITITITEEELDEYQTLKNKFSEEVERKTSKNRIFVFWLLIISILINVWYLANILTSITATT